MITTVMTYSALSMEHITQSAETVETKRISNLEKSVEEFEVLSVGNVNNKFNMTVSNTGDAPIQLTRLWVENTTDSTWPIAKFDLDVSIPSGGSVYNIGQNIGLTALDSQSYQMKLVSERGNTEKMLLNSVGEESLYLNLRATPTIVPSGFSTTLVLEVINTGANKLVNLQAEMDSVVKSCTSCSYDEVSGPSPTSFDSLNPGDIATFQWVYTMEGTTDGDNLTFTASLVNGVDEATAVVTLKTVETALDSSISFETGGLDSDVIIDDSILLFHMEQALVPSPGYQMFSAEADGGSTGLKIDMETKTAALGAFSAFTNNGSNTITIPAGNWNASLFLRSETIPTDFTQENQDMIFHFEDGDGVDPDNSEGSSARDLQTCSGSVVTYDNSAHNSGTCSSTSCTVDLNIADQPNMMILVVASDSTSTESLVTSVDEETNTNVGTEVSHQFVGNRESIYVFRIMDADITNKGGTNTITVNYDTAPSGAGISVHSFYGVDQSAPDDVDTNTRTEDDTISVTSTPIIDNSLIFTAFGADPDDSGFSCNGRGSGQTERADFAPSSARQCVTTEIKSSAGSDTQRIDTSEEFVRAGISASAYAPAPENDPDWRPGEGPHNSAAYYYDGVDECHESKNNVSNTNGNHLAGNNLSTSLWFKTDGVGQVSSEQMLVFWEGGGVYPNSEYYKISLGEDGTGRILFEHELSTSGSKTTTCRSVNEYDDGNWHHVVAVRTVTGDRCDFYITDLAGADEETPITSSPSHSGSASIDADGKWYVASREANGNYFKGLIDDVMHWNGDALDSTEADLLSHTNYGDTAHQFEVNLDVTDTDGNFVSNLFSSSAYAIPFQDAKSQADTVDAAYKMFNVTMSLPQIQVTTAQRLNFSTAFVPSTSTWEALELDMKIDDDGFTTPLPSYLQFPTPDNPFPNYLRYDPTDEMILFVNNSGEDGIYFIYSGTRISFDDGTASYASQIHYVNATIDPPDPEFAVDIDTDSIYIPSGDKAELRFYAEPSNHPCQGKGTTCIGGDPNGMVIPDGTYRLASWINGYTDQGEDFGRSVLIGNIIVED